MIELGETRVGGMNVRVHQSRQDCFSAEVDGLSMRSLQLQDLSIAADLHDAARFDGDGLGDRELRVNCHDLPPMEDEVGLLRERGRNGEKQRDKECDRNQDEPDRHKQAVTYLKCRS